MAKCKKCGVEYDGAEASIHDPLSFCRVCTRNIIYKEKRVSDNENKIDDDGNEIPIIYRRAKRHWLEGEDWLLLQTQANALSYEELRVHIEVNREIFGLLMNLEAQARVKKLHTNADTDVLVTVQTSQTTTVAPKAPKAVKKPKTQPDLDQVQAFLNALSPDILAQLSKKG